MSEWKDVTTAPDNQRVLTYGARDLTWCVAKYRHAHGWQVETSDSWEPMEPPKFWMPLPEPPL